MKISVLLKREPFDKIFVETLTLFLNNLSGKAHKITWQDRKFLKGLTRRNQYWYCNPLINTIFIKNADRLVFESLIGEYSDNPLKPWRNFLQKIYLELSLNNISSTYFAKNIIQISPPIKDAKKKLIIGGNTKIRIIDIAKKNVYVVLKKGFNKKYLDREIYIKENFQYLSVPKIKFKANNNLWYCEDYIVGIPPNRMKNEVGEKVINEIVEQLQRVLRETKEKILIKDYVNQIKGRIQKNISGMNFLYKKDRIQAEKIVTKLVSYFNNEEKSYVTIALCHGDFHQGNILSDGQKSWILDWEHSGKKQIGYDLFILLINSRIENGYLDRFSSLTNINMESFLYKLINNWPDLELNQKSIKESNIILFLLEELDFYIDESSNKVFYENPSVLNKRLSIFEEIINSLNYKSLQ